MKRKIFFLISAMSQIFLATYAIITANELAKTMLEDANAYPEAMRERITELFQNSGNEYIIMIAVISIILNGLIIYFTLSDKLLKKKGSVIAISIICFFTAFNPFVELIAIINIIVLAASKREKPEDYPEKVKTIPELKKEEVTKKKIILAIILIMIYFSQFIWSSLIPDVKMVEQIVGICFYIIMILLSITFFYDLYRNNFKVFKENFKTYYKNLIGKVGKYYLVYFGIAMIAMILSKAASSVNQNNIENLPLWYSMPLAIIYAPIVEEAVFRGCIRRLIKNDKIFIIVSAISFGLLHTIFTETSIYNAIILGLPYMAMGGFLAYLYTKTNNIFTNMTFHAFHNTLAMIITVFINGI